jgi:hypothetical protein
MQRASKSWGCEFKGYFDSSRRMMSSEVTILKIRAVLSALAVTTRWPSGENSALQTAAVWAFQLRDHLTGGGIPHPRRMVIAPRHHALAVGRKCCTPDAVGMVRSLRAPFRAPEFPQSERIDLSGCIKRHNTLAINLDLLAAMDLRQPGLHVPLN